MSSDWYIRDFVCSSLFEEKRKDYMYKIYLEKKNNKALLLNFGPNLVLLNQ